MPELVVEWWRGNEEPGEYIMYGGRVDCAGDTGWYYLTSDGFLEPVDPTPQCMFEAIDE